MNIDQKTTVQQEIDRNTTIKNDKTLDRDVRLNAIGALVFLEALVNGDGDSNYAWEEILILKSCLNSAVGDEFKYLEGAIEAAAKFLEYYPIK